MMVSPVPSPIELLKSIRQTKKNPPSIHSHFSFSVVLPPGPIGLGFMSPSRVHAPANISSFLCSGPGFGISIWATADAANIAHVAKIIAAFFMSCLAI